MIAHWKSNSKDTFVFVNILKKLAGNYTLLQFLFRANKKQFARTALFHYAVG
jgi:hypothetical protein